MKILNINVFYFWVILTLPVLGQAQTGSSSPEAMPDLRKQAEQLWQSLDLSALKLEVARNHGLSVSDQQLFVKFLDQHHPEEKFEFFQKASIGNITLLNLDQYLLNVKSLYESEVIEFLKVKEEFRKELELANLSDGMSVQAINGPCENVDFENGSTTGWTGQTGRACTNQVPCNRNNGFDNQRHRIMTTAMTDPHIAAANLPVVAPGGNYSIRLENTVNGGDAAIIRQTFRVTNENAILTYRYACVLEDPGDHHDAERPYFRVRLYDQNNNVINCASYEAVAKPSSLPGFIYQRTLNPNYGQGGGLQNNRWLDLYYKPWTTVSIPLLDYLGTNVTIEFIASDCSRGGHLGYAYLDAECLPISYPEEQIICNQTLTATAPAGFASYSWTGPGVVNNSANSQTLYFNKPGIYKVTLVPYSDNPCPETLEFEAIEHCPPPPITDEFCEETKGAGTYEVNLNAYNAEITDSHPDASVARWYSNAAATTPIFNPGSFTVSNNTRAYAVITYAGNIPNDTNYITFTVNSLPDIVFPDIPLICEGSSSFQISGVTPSGGIFSGTNITAGGNFNPVTAGSYPIKYVYTDLKQCKDSVIKIAEVEAKPTVNAGMDQEICETSTSIALSATSSTGTGEWTGGAGVFTPGRDVLNPNYAPSTTEYGTDVILTFTSTGSQVCPAVSDEIVITIERLPQVNAGTDNELCSDAPVFTLDAQVINTSSWIWSGGTGTFNPPNSLTGTYTPSTAELDAGEVTLTLSSTGTVKCPHATDQVTFKLERQPQIDAGADDYLCPDEKTADLNATVVNATGVIWTGGNGIFLPGNTATTGTYEPTVSERNDGSVTLTITTTGTTICPAVTDQITITIESLPTLDAGPNQEICSDSPVVNLAAIIDGSSTFSWSGGTGTFSPANTLTGTYTPSVSEVENGEVTLILTTSGTSACPSVSDKVTFKFEKIPTVNAGQDELFCADVESLSLNALVSNASGVIWSGGSGTFAPGNTSVSGAYLPALAEKSAGIVTLTIKTTGNVICPAAEDQVTFRFEPIPEVNAGQDSLLCSEAPLVTLNAAVTNAPSHFWSGGSGVFNPANGLAGTYTPSAGEISAGQVTLRLTTTGHQACAAVTDEVTYSFEKVPQADAGQGKLYCADVTEVPVSGVVTNSAGGIWSGGQGTFTSGNSALSGNYIPTAAEKSAGLVTLTLTTTGSIVCPAESDHVIFTFEPVPVVNAGTDKLLCASSPSITLNASTANAPSFIWSGGNGVFNPENSLTGIYTPTAAEINSGEVTLTLTTSGHQKCAPVSDQVKYRFEAVPVVNAGSDQNICENNVDITLSGTSSLEGAYWSGGAGNFQPSAQNLNAKYLPASHEIAAGNSIMLTLHSPVPEVCAPVADQMIINFTPKPVVYAGPDQKVCIDDPTVNISGTVSGAGGGIWTNGMGRYQNATTVLNNTYTAAQAEISSAGNVMLILTSTNNGNCRPESDTMNITIIPLPVLDAGPDIVNCVGADAVLNTIPFPQVSYSWEKSGTIVSASHTTIALVEKDDQQFIVNATDQYGCKNSDTVVIFGIPIPFVTINDTALCEGGKAVLNLQKAQVSNQLSLIPAFTWEKDGVTIPGNSHNNLETTTGGIYIVRSSLGMCNDQDSATVTFYPLPKPEMIPAIKYCPEESEKYIVLDAGNFSKYIWDTGDTSRTISADVAGVYDVMVFNEFGCSAPASTELIICCPPRVFVSNSFSPNADMTNDSYNIYGANFKNFNMLIFNRWGEIIFESRDRNQAWDGKYLGEYMPVGVYPWVIKYEGECEDYKGPHQMEGSVTIIR